MCYISNCNFEDLTILRLGWQSVQLSHSAHLIGHHSEVKSGLSILYRSFVQCTDPSACITINCEPRKLQHPNRSPQDSSKLIKQAHWLKFGLELYICWDQWLGTGENALCKLAQKLGPTSKVSILSTVVPWYNTARYTMVHNIMRMSAASQTSQQPITDSDQICRNSASHIILSCRNNILAKINKIWYVPSRHTFTSNDDFFLQYNTGNSCKMSL